MTSRTEVTRPASSPGAGISNGIFLSARVRLALTIRWAIVGSATRNARAISGVVRPPMRRSVTAARALGRQHRMAGDEDQPEQVVADMVVHRLDVHFPERLRLRFHVAPYFLE